MKTNAATIDREETKKDIYLTKSQTEFIYGTDRHPAYVGGWGTGKTLAGIVKAIKLSNDHPGNLGIVFRKEYTDLKDSTVKDFEDHTNLKVDSGREVIFDNGSRIMFRHLEELNNIQNINLGWFWIEQAEELESDEQFFKLWDRLRRQNTKHTGFITANTKGHNWIYKLWKLKTLENGVLYEAKTSDNAHLLDKDFLASLEILKVRKPKVYNRFVMNSWDEEDTVDIIILPSWVSAAVSRNLIIQPPIRRVVSIDVARYGDDKTTFYAIENNKVLAHEEWEKRSTMETVGLALQFAKKNKDIKSFAVNEIGVGAGVADRLHELEYQVIYVNSSKDSRFKDRFYNLRAEIYATAADKFEAGRVQIEPDDNDLYEQLSWAKYNAIKSNGIYQVEAKDDIKKRYGRSPDNADAFLAGLWALDQVTVSVKQDRWASDEKPKFNPEVV